MRLNLFTIDDVFEITGRGIVVTGELELNSLSCKIGKAVVLVQLNGQELKTEISGIEHLKPIDVENFNWNKLGIMFKDVGKKEDVPIGTKVFLEITA